MDSKKICGSWIGLYHWSEKEGARWNSDLKNFTSSDWKQMVQDMHSIGMDIIVIQEVFRNQQYHGRHNIQEKGYKGKAFYPSKLYSERMDIADNDPIEAILSEADNLGMDVFLGVGLYAWFDFSPHSLEWHKEIMKELWEIYGHHESLYGWYISEEVNGSIEPSRLTKKFWNHKKITKQYRENMINFFMEMKNHSENLGRNKPLMLAPNCHFMEKAANTWKEVLKYLDIVCPFGFNRMPKGDVSGKEVARWLRSICDDSKKQLWLDMEIFLFGQNGELIPRPIEEIIEELNEYNMFNKVICYQYPGLMNSENAKIKPGGNETIKLFNDYNNYFKTFKK